LKGRLAMSDVKLCVGGCDSCGSLLWEDTKHWCSPESELARLRADLARVRAERDEAREAHAFLNGCVESIKSNHSRSMERERRARAVVEAARATVTDYREETWADLERALAAYDAGKGE
jgi:chromosome segregation ATPase